MSTYFMFGKYSSEAIKGIAASRTEKSRSIISDLGGSIMSGYALLGNYDIALIVELPDIETAMKASLALNKLTGVAFSTVPAVSIETFDKLSS